MSVASDNLTYMIRITPVLRPYPNVRGEVHARSRTAAPLEHLGRLIDRLFVEHLLTRQYVSPDESPENWLDEAEPRLDVMSENRPLVQQGPSIGKSNLLNNVAWLRKRPSENALVSKFGWHLPLPMVLKSWRGGDELR